jgi:hypothetical protein
MTENTALAALIACPRCDRTPLDSLADSYRCPACDADYPAVGGIPWVFAEPGAALGEWRGKLHFSLRQLEQDRARIARALGTGSLGEAARERLQALAAATESHLSRLAALLAPLALDSLTASHESYLALRTRMPSDQGLTTYYNNVHRDWCWGEAENRLSLQIVKDAAGGNFSGRTLVLGAGAGRLAYDLHMNSDADSTVVLDFNPLLLLLAQRITNGEAVELYEFPIAPKTAHDQAVLRTLSAESPARAGLYYVLADAHRPPFAKGSFDTVVTPWLIDILPEKFDALCARLNVLLRDGGQWINFGSLSFHGADPALRYGPEETAQIVAAHGFDTPTLSETRIPYMCSPASRHGRQELVVSWRAAKTAAVKKVPRYEALPDWLVRGKEPVPLSESFKMQAMSTRIHAFIMSLIDGRRSVKDMAAVFADQKLMTKEEAEPAIRAFLIKMYEDSQRS